MRPWSWRARESRRSARQATSAYPPRRAAGGAPARPGCRWSSSAAPRPAAATRVSLAGKTVMPMIVETHTHLNTTRDGLIRDLKQRAYFGVSGALSLGLDGFELLGMRNENIPGAARFFSG